MTAPAHLYQLVPHFHDNPHIYKAGRYNEAQVRQEFIDPLFRLLDWDIDNEKGRPETYKEVIHEDSIKVGGGTRAPDYCFRIDGHRKFFVEAKKPSVNLDKDTHPAYQLRRYGWSAKLPISILADFEEFSVYDCRVQPAQIDQATVARIMYFTYDQYPTQWDTLVNTFSPEAIHTGAFDRYIEGQKVKNGTTEVTEPFCERSSASATAWPATWPCAINSASVSSTLRCSASLTGSSSYASPKIAAWNLTASFRICCTPPTFTPA